MGADQVPVKNTFGDWCIENRDKNSIVSQRAKNIILSGLDERPQDNTTNLSRPRAWMKMNSPALSPTLMRPCPERRGVIVGCLYLEIEGQSCLVDNVGRGTDETNDKLTIWAASLTKSRKINMFIVFPHIDDAGHLSASSSKNKFRNLLLKRSAFH